MTPPGGLHATGLGKRYGATAALAGVDLHLAGGEVLALMGANGAGKSTLYRLLSGAERPDCGRIVIDGIDVTALPAHARARCGLRHLPQDASIFRGLSVERNILLALEAHEPDRALRADRLEQLLAQFDLTGLRRVMPGQLSGGQRRRCEIARMMTGCPRYVLLDEPFAGLDPIAIERFGDTIRALRECGLGIVITDHDIRATLRLADRVLVLDGGHLLAQGPTAEVVAMPHLRGLWLSEDFRL